MIKKILLSLGIVVAVAVIVVGVLFVINQAQPQQMTNGDEADATTKTTVPDLSKDYGACNVVTMVTVKEALGTVANTLQEPQNMGIVGDSNIGPGVENLVSDSQLCAYAFASGGTFENGFNSNNAFSIQVTRYSNEGGPTAFITQIRNSGIVEEVPDISQNAFYSANTVSQGPGATYTYKLQVFNNNELVVYTIRQPADASTFTAETAKTALTALAKRASE